MTQVVVTQLLSLTIAACFGGLVGFLGGQVKRLTARDRAIEQGIGVILRRQLMEDYETHVINGHPLTMEQRREIDECFAAYNGLGLNGTGRRAYEALCDLDLTI